MIEAQWNSGMAYGFSVIKAMMWIIGVWPLQQNELICTIRWFIIFIAESLTLLQLLIEPFKSCGDTKDALEIFIIIETGVHAWTNMIFARMYMRKVAINVISAIDDWSTSSTKKESYLIMTGYARIGRVITMSQVLIGFIAATLYFTAILVENKQQVVTIGNDTVTLWNFVLPATCLFKGISATTYKTLYAMQILQAFLLFVAESASDSFFFSITMHLCGQLKLLRIRFDEIGREINEKNHREKLFRHWIKRHCQLIQLARNIEDAFNINILIRLAITTVVIAVSGTRILVSIEQRDFTDVVKNVVFIQYFILQSFLFTHAGDTLQHQSESIVTTIYSTMWHEMPVSTMKDLIFIMIRTKVPLRLSAGKFFYITRSTITDILTTALTYISFLEVAMEK